MSSGEDLLRSFSTFKVKVNRTQTDGDPVVFVTFSNPSKESANQKKSTDGKPTDENAE
jgi:hypothetical protein